MDFLADHFARVADMTARNIPIIRGIFFDVGGTLDAENGLVWEFAKWNHASKVLRPTRVFTRDADDAALQLELAKRDISQIGADTLDPKSATYNAAYMQQHQHNLAAQNQLEDKSLFKPIPAYVLELVVDDSKPLIEGVLGAPMVLTHWNPYDRDVYAYLRERRYESFKP
jgi:hypothetical protein